MSTTLKHYENTAVPEAAALLTGDDAITYSVLINILQSDCAHTFTDHENIIICHSTPPYPVWVWCRDSADPAQAAAIAGCLRTRFPWENSFRWNLSYALFEALQKADPYFVGIPMDMGLLSYRMDALLPVTHPSDGYCDLAKPEEIDLLCKLWHDACLEMEGLDHNKEFCRARVTRHLENRSLFTWRNEAGEITAITSRGDAAPFSKVAAVYTVPEYRRRGYAMNLVHAVSAGMIEDGFTPILYTDANYAASNACYQKIGYKQVGSLCCAGKK